MARLSVNRNPEKRELTGGPSRQELLERIKQLEAAGVSPDAVRTGSPFVDIWPIQPEILEAVTASMKRDGYDSSQPLIVWEEAGLLIDGHTRLQAAKAAGLKRVPVVTVSFPDEQAALAYTYALQFNRRNLNDADRFIFLEGVRAWESATLHKPPKPGRPKDPFNKQVAAGLLGVSERTAQKFINVLKQAGEQVKAQVRSGELSIHHADKLLRPAKASKDTRSREKVSKAQKEDRRSDTGLQGEDTALREDPEVFGVSGRTPAKVQQGKQRTPFLEQRVQHALKGLVYTGRTEGRGREYYEALEAVAEELKHGMYMVEALELIRKQLKKEK